MITQKYHLLDWRVFKVSSSDICFRLPEPFPLPLPLLVAPPLPWEGFEMESICLVSSSSLKELALVGIVAFFLLGSWMHPHTKLYI